MDPLAGFSCIPLVTKGVAFEQRDPSLKLYLAGNALARLPGSIYNIEHLTVLSLRGNALGEIPPAIGKLGNLEELNVSQNALSFLPYELLELITQSQKLKKLFLHPNPFYEPQGQTAAPEPPPDVCDEKAADPDGESPVDRHQLLFAGSFRGVRPFRSPVQFSDTLGRIHSKFHMAPAPESTRQVKTEPEAEAPAPPTTSANPAAASHVQASSRVPSLLEMALQACYHTSQLAQLASLLPEGAPPHVRELLDRTLAQREAGGMACTVCKRFVVIPRTAWLEWWTLGRVLAGEQTEPLSRNPAEQFVPFIRRGCSWKCLPAGAS